MFDFERFTLANGLRVIHSYVPSTAMLAIDVLYDTGARDERRDLTGIAHLFEHLMFGGSANIDDFDAELQDAGGKSNAWTSNDFTNFYDLLPAVNASTAFHLESDRMLALSFNPRALDVQRSVVIEEFKQQCLNRPYGDLTHGLRSALYSAEHPYSWPVIGIKPEHISSVTDDDVRQWFYAHYAPNNAVLAIAGNLPYDRGRELAEQWFGDIPFRDIAPRRLPDPGFPSENKTVNMFGKAPVPTVVVALPMDPYGTHDYRVADCITDLLSAGRSSRFTRNLVIPGAGGIIEADASIIGSEGPGFVMLNARVADGSDDALDNAAALMIDQLAALAQPGNLTAYELERTLNRFESTFLLANLDTVPMAQNLAMAEMHGEDINDTVRMQRTISIDDIARVAAKLAEVPRVTVRYRQSE